MSRFVRLAVIPLVLFMVACTRDPQTQSRKLVENGTKFFNKGKYKEASIMYRRALAKDQKNGDGYYRLGLTLLKLGSYPDASRALRRAVDLQPNNSDAASKLGDIYWVAYAARPGARSKFLLSELQELSSSILKRDPKSFDGLRFAGYVELANARMAIAEKDKDLGPALEKFEKANAVKPNDPDLSLVYADTLLAAGRAEQAEKIAREIIDRNKTYAPMYDLLLMKYLRERRVADAEALVKQKIQNNPYQELFRMQLAMLYFGTQRRAEMESTLQDILKDKKNFPLGRLAVGTFFYRLRDFDRARREFEAGAAESTGEAKETYQTQIVELLAAQNKPKDALLLAEEVLKSNPKNSVALAQRSALAVLSGDPAKVQMAASDLQSLVTKTPTNHVYRFQLARALIAKGQTAQAKTQLEEAIRLRPDFPAGQILLAQLLNSGGDFAKALQIADQVIAAEPANLSARLIRTASLLGIRDVRRAKEELQAIIEKAPNSSDAQYQLGLINLSERNYKDALTMFDNMRKSNPGDVRGLIGMVETEMAKNDYPAAVELVKAALQKDPNRSDFKLALANIMARAGQLDESIRLFQELVQRDPKSADLNVKLGEVFRLKGDVNSAVGYFKKAMTLDPNNTQPLILTAMMFESAGRPAEAKPLYEQIIRLDPTNPIALNNLAFLKAEEGTDLDQALAYAQRAKQRAPLDPNVADTLGWVYIKKNLSEDAVRVFNELVSKYPSNPTYRFHLAMALFQKGDRPTAKKHCEQALQDKPSQKEQGQIRDLLAKLG